MNKETNKWIEEFDEETGNTVKGEILYRYDNLKLAEDSADTVNKTIKLFIKNLLKQQKQSLVEKIDGMKIEDERKIFTKEENEMMIELDSKIGHSKYCLAFKTGCNWGLEKFKKEIKINE